MISNLVTVRAQKPPAAAPYRRSDLVPWPVTSFSSFSAFPVLEKADVAADLAEPYRMPSRPGELPSRPGEFRPESLTDPDMILSHHPARATA